MRYLRIYEDFKHENVNFLKRKKIKHNKWGDEYIKDTPNSKYNKTEFEKDYRESRLQSIEDEILNEIIYYYTDSSFKNKKNILINFSYYNMAPSHLEMEATTSVGKELFVININAEDPFIKNYNIYYKLPKESINILMRYIKRISEIMNFDEEVIFKLNSELNKLTN